MVDDNSRQRAMKLVILSGTPGSDPKTSLYESAPCMLRRVHATLDCRAFRKRDQEIRHGNSIPRSERDAGRRPISSPAVSLSILDKGKSSR